LSDYEALSREEFEILCLNLEKEKNPEILVSALYFRFATDLELYSKHWFPHYCKYPFSQLHREDFQSINFGERSVRRVRAAPRGYAKSTFKAFIKIIHDVCYGLEDYIVIFSNTDSQAHGKVKDIRNELLDNTPLLNFYGIKFKSKRPPEGSFEVLCGDHSVKIEGYGTGAQIRGIRHGAARPSKLVFDDVEHSEEVENESLREKYETWFFSDVLKSGNEFTNVEFVGTVLHRDALLCKLLKNPLYNAKKYQAVISWSEREDLWTQWREILTNLDNDTRLADANAYYEKNQVEMLKGTEVLWPEKEPYIYLMKELVDGGRRAFFKEKQNEPLGDEDKIFTKFHWYREVWEPEHGIFIENSKTFIEWDIFINYRTFGAMDPATGQTKAKSGKKGDFTSIAIGKQDHKGRLFLHHDWTKRKAPTEYIKAVFDLHQEFEFEKFGVETNLYRNLLLPNMVQYRNDLEKEKKRIIKLPFYDIETVENKEKRIFSLEPKVTNGWILFNRAISQELFNQFQDFPKSDHDDGPDVVEMVWSMVNNRYKMSPVDVHTMGGR
jgi:predicted phage terminase large subunit-like protein